MPKTEHLQSSLDSLISHALCNFTWLHLSTGRSRVSPFFSTDPTEEQVDRNHAHYCCSTRL